MSEVACAKLTVSNSAGGVVVDTPLTDQGAGLYRTTITLSGDDNYRFQFRGTPDPGCDFGLVAGGISRSVNARLDASAPGSFLLTTTTHAAPDGAGSVVVARGASVDLEWERPAEAGSGIDRYEVVAGGITRLSSTTTRATLPLATIANLSSLEVVAVDRAGNRRSQTNPARLLIDDKAPTVRWAEPANSWLRGTVRLRALVADGALGSGAVKVGFSSRPTTPGTTPRADLGEVADLNAPVISQRVPWNTKQRGTTDGRVEVSAFAVDLAGNVGLAKRVFHVDNRAPVFTTKARLMAVSRARTTTPVAVRVKDVLSPQLRYSWVIRKGTSKRNFIKSRVTTVKDRGVIRIPVPGKRLGSGNYRLTLSVSDLAGNTITRAYVVRSR